MTPTLIRTNSPLLLTTEGGEKMRVLFSKPARRSRNGFLLALGPIVDSAARRREMAAVALSGRWRSLSPFTYIIRTGEKKSPLRELCVLYRSWTRKRVVVSAAAMYYSPPVILFWYFTLERSDAPPRREREGEKRGRVLYSEMERSMRFTIRCRGRARDENICGEGGKREERERGRARVSTTNDDDSAGIFLAFPRSSAYL